MREAVLCNRDRPNRGSDDGLRDGICMCLPLPGQQKHSYAVRGLPAPAIRCLRKVDRLALRSSLANVQHQAHAKAAARSSCGAPPPPPPPVLSLLSSDGARPPVSKQRQQQSTQGEHKTRRQRSPCLQPDRHPLHYTTPYHDTTHRHCPRLSDGVPNHPWPHPSFHLGQTIPHRPCPSIHACLPACHAALRSASAVSRAYHLTPPALSMWLTISPSDLPLRHSGSSLDSACRNP